MAKTLTQKNEELKKRVKALESELQKVKEDREKFRNYWSSKMKRFIEINGKGNTIDAASMILDMAQFFNGVEKWWW